MSRKDLINQLPTEYQTLFDYPEEDGLSSNDLDNLFKYQITNLMRILKVDDLLFAPEAILSEEETELRDRFGFLVRTDNPFVIFKKLQELAASFSSGKILDLSRGNPGLGFCPSEKSRKFFGFLAIVDTVLNSNDKANRIHEATEDEFHQVMKIIETCAFSNFQEEVASEHLEVLNEVTTRVIECAKKENLNISKLGVLKGIFQYSTITGGTYHSTNGEQIARIVVADLYRNLLDDPNINSKEIIFTSGVNDAIGTLFKMLGEEGLGHLKKGDTVAVSSPAYAPYFAEIISRGLIPVELRTDPETGEVDLSQLESCEDKIKAFFIINPNNPTGLMYEKATLKRVAEIAAQHGAILITDEIYAQFYENPTSVWSEAQDRTIYLSGRSKIERGPGLRFGDVLISDATNDYLTNTFGDSLTTGDFRKEFVLMKGPGGTSGSFHHTASVPGPSQMLGTLSILLGEEERSQYVKLVNENMDTFHEELGLPRNKATYYSLFNLDSIPGSTKEDLSIEQKLCELAERGVILVPALKFFSERAQEESNKSSFVRAALPNVAPADAKEVAKRIKEYVQG